MKSILYIIKKYLCIAKQYFFKKIGIKRYPLSFLPIKKIYSQYGQDYFIFNIIYRKIPGFYVDVGARCGKIISNTYHLEKKNWKGICIEPHPDLYEQLVQNRNCMSFNFAISDEIKDDLSFVKFLEEPYGHSGLLETFRSPKRLKSINHEIISVKTIDLTSLLDKVDAPKFIEYLDIDVEGHEYECLLGIDFKKYTFGIIGVETDLKSNNYNDIKLLLKRNNYVPFAVIGSDTFFINE